jgi:hypothetical protein
MLFSGDSLLPASEEIMRGFSGAVQAGTVSRPTVFTEFLDADRFPGAENQGRMLRLLQGKYATTHIDLVVALGPSALKFLAGNRPSLFPDAPIVFAAINEARLRGLAMPANTSGVISHFIPPPRSTWRALQPNATGLVVIRRRRRFDREWENRRPREAAAFEGRLRRALSSGLPMKELHFRSASCRGLHRPLPDHVRRRRGKHVVSRDAVEEGGERRERSLWRV